MPLSMSFSWKFALCGALFLPAFVIVVIVGVPLGAYCPRLETRYAEPVPSTNRSTRFIPEFSRYLTQAAPHPPSK